MSFCIITIYMSYKLFNIVQFLAHLLYAVTVMKQTLSCATHFFAVTYILYTT